jgi:phosphatidylserine/phosphatidylglycerophosphate/cardiolipin synthase-like enzyme
LSILDAKVTRRSSGLKFLTRLVQFPDGFRRHRFTLKRGQLSAKEIKNMRQDTWWGNEQTWFPGGTPPRQHNLVTPLIDGENYFVELQKALDHAQSYVFIIGWAFTPYIPISRADETLIKTSRLLEVLDDVSRKVPVRILLWSGASFLFQPNIKETRKIQKEVNQKGQGDLKLCLDQSQHWTHCHHQKAVVIDGKVAFVGGMDLTTFMGDRFDKNSHSLRSGINWHDVQLKLEGEVVSDVESNFRQRWLAVADKEDQLLPAPDPLPDYEPDWQIPAQIVRTIPRRVYPFAKRGEFGIFHSYMSLIAQARHFIYLENQYFWSPHILTALSSAINKTRADPFRIVVVLPASADDGKFDNDKHVQKLRALDNGRGIISFYSLYTSGPNMGRNPFSYRDIYVHSKTTIIDDEWFMVGSANLNNRGMITDSEIDALVHDPALARQLRVDLWAEHLKITPEEVGKQEIVDLIDREWVQKAATNQDIFKRKKEPLPSTLFPYQIGKMPGTWLLEDIEAMTFEH